MIQSDGTAEYSICSTVARTPWFCHPGILGPMATFLMLRKSGECCPILPCSSSGRIFFGLCLKVITQSCRLLPCLKIFYGSFPRNFDSSLLLLSLTYRVWVSYSMFSVLENAHVLTTSHTYWSAAVGSRPLPASLEIIGLPDRILWNMSTKLPQTGWSQTLFKAQVSLCFHCYCIPCGIVLPGCNSYLSLSPLFAGMERRPILWESWFAVREEWIVWFWFTGHPIVIRSLTTKKMTTGETCQNQLCEGSHPKHDFGHFSIQTQNIQAQKCSHTYIAASISSPMNLYPRSKPTAGSKREQSRYSDHLLSRFPYHIAVI